MRLLFSRAALSDLMRLREFIAEHNPTAAFLISKRLRGAINSLIGSPQMGRPVENIIGEIRELIWGRYVVRYEIREDDLFVLRVWHGKESR